MGVERIEEHPAMVADGSSSSSVSCLCKNAHWLARDATETMRRHSSFAARGGRAGVGKGRRQRDGETPRRFRHGKKIPPPGVGRVFEVRIPSGSGYLNLFQNRRTARSEFFKMKIIIIMIIISDSKNGRFQF
jgi:hypothetical protein